MKLWNIFREKIKVIKCTSFLFYNLSRKVHGWPLYFHAHYIVLCDSLGSIISLTAHLAHLEIRSISQPFPFHGFGQWLEDKTTRTQNTCPTIHWNLTVRNCHKKTTGNKHRKITFPHRVVPILLSEGKQLKKYTGLGSRLFSESWISMHMWHYTDYVRVLTFQTHWAFLRLDGMNTQETLKSRASTSVRYYNIHVFLTTICQDDILSFCSTIF